MILLQNVKNIGKAGDIKEVADGFARNFLLKNKLARMATESAIRENSARKEKEEKNKDAEVQRMRELGERLSQVSVSIKAKARNGKLFGSIGAKEIARALKERGFNVPEIFISLQYPIKETGESDVAIRLGHGIETAIKVSVEAE